MTKFSVADLCDENQEIQIAQPIFKLFGKNHTFFGKIRTVKVLDDNSFVKKLLEEKVDGDVMVIDGGGSLNCSLVGDNLAKKAIENGWSGFVINGCIRDSEIINTMAVGIKALNIFPRKSVNNNRGSLGDKLEFAGVVFKEGMFLYSDYDGIIISDRNLLENNG